MNPERWQQIKALFNGAMDLPAEQRGAFLDEHCGEDRELRETVAELLVASEAPHNILEIPASQDGDTGLDHAPAMIGRHIGPFRLMRELGRGGMGAVYLGERADGQFRQQVAVKLVKRGMDTDFILGRFRQERQILASLSHPYIARLLDGGSTEDGLPFFIMEYVEGETLFDFAAQRALNLPARLELFCRVCEAVASIHALRVVHRDLKPSNILVTLAGTPKLLDFGIAKWLNPDPGEETPPPTATQMRLLTPEYASPEQIQGFPVTPASDVYSAGVLLYELITGRRLYRFNTRTAHDVASMICGTQPVTPSDAVLMPEHRAPLSFAGVPGGTTAERLACCLAGDLDNVVLKSLRKDPLERYATAEDLEAEIRRFLAGQAVQAAPMFSPPAPRARPEPRPTDNQALAVLPLKVLGRLSDDDSGSYLGVGLADTLITRLSQIRSFAVRPTSSILRFTVDTDVFQAGRELGVRYVLDGNLRRSGALLRVTVQLLDVVREATVWAQQFHSEADDVLQLEDDISAQVVQSLAPQLPDSAPLPTAKRGTSHEAAFQAYMRGRFHWSQYRPESMLLAKSHFERAVQLDPRYALAYVGLADCHHWGSIFGLFPSQEAVPKAHELAELALNLNPDLGEAHATLGFAVLHAERNLAKAARHFRLAIERAPNYPPAHEWYGAFLIGTGSVKAGRAAYLRALDVDPVSLRTKNEICLMHYQTGFLEEGLTLADELVDMDPNYPMSHFMRGNILEQLGRYDEAVAASSICRNLMGGAAVSLFPLCFALQGAGRTEEARRVAEDLVTASRTAYVKPWFLGMTYTAIGEFNRAFACFECSFAESDPWVVWFGTEPKLEPLRSDSRYDRLLRLINPGLDDP